MVRRGPKTLRCETRVLEQELHHVETIAIIAQNDVGGGGSRGVHPDVLDTCDQGGGKQGIGHIATHAVPPFVVVDCVKRCRSGRNTLSK